MQIAQSLYSYSQSESLLNEEGRLPFDLLTGRATIERGVLRAEGLSFESPNLRASGHGRAYLSEQKLDMVFDPQVLLDKGNGAKRWEDTGVPILVTGTFEAPEVSLGAGSLPGDSGAGSGSGRREPPEAQILRGVLNAVRSFFDDNAQSR